MIFNQNNHCLKVSALLLLQKMMGIAATVAIA